MSQISTYLQDLLAREGPRVRVVGILGIADLDRVDPHAFAEACLKAGACKIPAEECQRIVCAHYGDLFQVLHRSDVQSIPLERDFFQVTLVRMAWKSVLSNLRPKLEDALRNDELQEKLRGHDPIETLCKWVSDEFETGSVGRQRDLKSVLRMLDEDLKAIYSGISKVASVLGRDPADYAGIVVAGCCNPSVIPQKGLGFALTLLARAGGSNRSFGAAFQNNLELFLSEECSRLELNTGRSVCGRLSETKTVLSALQLAHVEKGKHFVKPRFPSAVKDFLQALL